ncbi:MAG: pilus assembly PilX family protein, partial [Planctomycetota bacterium]
MAPVKKKSEKLDRQGAVLIVSMIFVLIFSALAVSMATMSGNNVQIASNQHKVGSAIASTESGLETMRFWINRVEFPSSTLQSDYFGTIVSNLQSDLSANSITNVTVYNNGTIPPVPLDSATGQAFEGEILIDPNNAEILQLSSIGGADITRTIRVQYDIQPYEYPIF